MNNHIRNILIGFAICVLTIVGIELLFNPAILISILAGVVLGVIAVIILIAQSRGEKPVEVAKEVVEQAVRPDPGAEERPVHEQLCRLNLRVRVEGVSPSVLLVTEELIDLLRGVIPQALEQASGSETTFDLKELATENLPRLVNEFLDLAEETRVSQETTFTEQLRGLINSVETLKQHLDQGQLHEYEVEHGFLSVKFA